MGNHKLRQDTECQNCGQEVTQKYCPNCGQANTETRQSFVHLAGHVVEDLVHYDGAFWKTIKYLLFRPARLTKEYIAGRRISYVPPVKLYIFISFIAFFLPGIIPSNNSEYDEEPLKEATHQELYIKPSVTLKESVYLMGLNFNNGAQLKNPLRYRSLREMDSIEALKLAYPNYYLDTDLFLEQLKRLTTFGQLSLF